MHPIWQLPKKYRDKKKKRQDDRMMENELTMVDKGVLSSAAKQLRLHRISSGRRASAGNIDEAWVEALSTRNSFSLPSEGPLMDVTLVGKDNFPVRASRSVLACDSFILDEIFFRKREWQHYDAMKSRLEINFCTYDVIRAAVHHSFDDKIPSDFDITSPNEEIARKLAQLDHLAYIYKINDLGGVTNGALRKLINQRAVLACAIFDELSIRQGPGTVDSIKRYALDSIRDMPMDTLLGGGVQWMKEESVEVIILDHEMDVDEFYRFKILTAWATAGGEDRLTAARRLAEHIELKFIEPDLLISQVKDSGYFDVSKITGALNAINNSLADRENERECVLVEGAGSEVVNGIYCRENDEVGVGDEEILFVKEADDGYSDTGLFLWGTTWHIALCADYSNTFYKCEDPPNKSSTELVPNSHWVVMDGGVDPPPTCTYRSNKEIQGKRSSSERAMLAPSLEEMIDPTIVEKRRSRIFDKTRGDVSEKRTLTLVQMMNLPEDQKEVRDTYV
ncbi:hypothetical protein ACHAW5_004994 [Stephanodiscus triporus]|uniref:BTB domain-containing protein n=1 Tax=Stephanodiscus triporus TaxID=2934178 RepID=A0ABD3MF12_9STRA